MTTELVNVITKWAIDPMHSEVEFKVKNLLISTITGRFRNFECYVESPNEDFTDAHISFNLDVNSIDTNQPQRDAHLKSNDFFNAEQYPKIWFRSTSFYKINTEYYKLQGELTIRDITRHVELDVIYGGQTYDSFNNHRAGFEVSGVINRKDFNIWWDERNVLGNQVVSDEVKLHMNIQLIEQR
ncbi:MAG: YceI family protein [Cytophagaceae bacterium]|nr:YceI family protein [Cytophagaceae bacterium]MDW8455399.1 YceI family protein [Cytophagaceae bacterium]